MQQGAPLFNHVVGEGEEPLGDFKAEGFCCLEIDPELQLRRPLDWDIGGHGALENLVDETGGAAIQIGRAHRVGHEPAGHDGFSVGKHSRNSLLGRELGNELPIGVIHGVVRNEQCVADLNVH